MNTIAVLPIHASLAQFLQHFIAHAESLVLATVVATQGSTYRKPGADMLIAGDGRAAGLLSGGCIEADLLERARQVLRSGEALRVEYDARTSDDVIWGLGLGCEGAMSILLTRIGPENGYQPLHYIEACREADRPGAVAWVIASQSGQLGRTYWPDAVDGAPHRIATVLRDPASIRTTDALSDGDETFLITPVQRPPRVVVLGAGPDAAPLVELAGLMQWRVDVKDHRPAYAVTERFPSARSVTLQPLEQLRPDQFTGYDAAVVMSHHLLADRAYLAALADTAVPYVGLLGPATRRARLLHELGETAKKFGERLYGPIGLDIGAHTPETIALAIASEIQAVLRGRSGGSFRETAR